MQTKQQYYLAELSSRILLDKMVPEDRHYLASCIYAISLGQDANKIFKNVRSRGSSDKRMASTARIKLAISFMAALMRPSYQSENDYSKLEPSGLGLSLQEALDKTAEDFGIDRSNLERYWHQAKRNGSGLLNSHFSWADTLPE